MNRVSSKGIDYSYKDKVTDISRFFEEIYDVFSNQNLGTVIVATDGIYNQGNNPVYVGNKLNVPIFSIALGQFSVKGRILLPTPPAIITTKLSTLA